MQAVGPTPSSALHTPTHSPPSSTVVGDSRYPNGTPLEETTGGCGEPMDVDLKRKIDEVDVPQQTQKRIRVGDAVESIP